MDVLETLDYVCQSSPHRKYKNKENQLIEALYTYVVYEDDSLFFSKEERWLIRKFTKEEILCEIIKNTIAVYKLKKELGLNKVFYIDKLPDFFNEEELEYTIHNLYTLGNTKAVDIYIHTFDKIPMKCVKHFISSRYTAKKINKNTIERYIKENETLQIEFRRINSYYKKEETII